MARYGGGRPTAEGSLTLNLYKLMRDGMCAPRKYGSGALHWSTNGIRTGSMGFESALGDDRGFFIRLRYTSTLWNGEKYASDYRIELTATPQPFGGKRWWFVCPKTGALVWKLYLPSGAVTFASRQHYRLGYRCQREGSHDRDINRAFKLRRRLGSEDGLNAPIAKPRDALENIRARDAEGQSGGSSHTTLDHCAATKVRSRYINPAAVIFSGSVSV